MLCERYLTMSFRPSKAQPAGQMLSPPMSAPRGPLQTRVGFPWISLDSLIRIEPFSMSYTEQSTKIFSHAFDPGSPKYCRCDAWAGGRAELRHRKSLAQILIFCNLSVCINQE